jgi:hypothetical protein
MVVEGAQAIGVDEAFVAVPLLAAAASAPPRGRYGVFYARSFSTGGHTCPVHARFDQD